MELRVLRDQNSLHYAHDSKGLQVEASALLNT
jgi:hypothetical protein